MPYKKTGGVLTIDGLDTSKPAEYLKPSNTPNCQNVRVNRSIIRKREGQTKLGSGNEINTSTIFYLAANGTDAATTLTDGALTPKTFTLFGDAQIDTAQSVFGGASLLLDGTGDYGSTPDHADFSFGTGKFDIRFRIRFNSLTGKQTFFSQYADANNLWYMQKNITTHKLTMKFIIGGVVKGEYIMTSNWAPSTGTWYELRFVRDDAGNGYIMIDGTPQALTASTAFGTNDVGNVASAFFVGQDGNSAGYVNGWMDEMIGFKGQAYDTAAYTLRTTPFTDVVLNEYCMGGRYLLREGVGYHVRVGPTKIQLYDTVNIGWTNIHGTLLTATNGDPVDFATPLLSGKRILCITNFIDNIRKYTGSGTTADLGGTPPQSKFMQDYRDYLVLAYIKSGGTFPTMVQWCDTSNPENWSTGNAGNKQLNEDNEDITGLALFGEYVSVHKNSAVYLGYNVTTSAVFQFDRKNTGSGAVNYATIQNLPTANQAFLGLDGIRLFNGISAPIIEDPVTDELREGMNFQFIKRSWSLVVPELDEYWCGLPIGSSQVGDSVYKYNYKTGAVHKDYRANAICAWKYSNTVNLTWEDIAVSWDAYTERWDSNSLGVNTFIPIIGDTDGITSYRDITVNNDLGVAIDAFFETKDFEADEKGRLAEWIQMEFWCKGQSVTIEYSIDGGTTWAGASTVTLDSDYPTDDAPDIYYFHVVSTKVRFRFRNNILASTFSLKQFVVSYMNREMRS